MRTRCSPAGAADLATLASACGELSALHSIMLHGTSLAQSLEALLCSHGSCEDVAPATVFLPTDQAWRDFLAARRAGPDALSGRGGRAGRQALSGPLLRRHVAASRLEPADLAPGGPSLTLPTLASSTAAAPLAVSVARLASGRLEVRSGSSRAVAVAEGVSLYGGQVLAYIIDTVLAAAGPAGRAPGSLLPSSGGDPAAATAAGAAAAAAAATAEARPLAASSRAPAGAAPARPSPSPSPSPPPPLPWFLSFVAIVFPPPPFPPPPDRSPRPPPPSPPPPLGPRTPGLRGHVQLTAPPCRPGSFQRCSSRRDCPDDLDCVWQRDECGAGAPFRACCLDPPCAPPGASAA